MLLHSLLLFIVAAIASTNICCEAVETENELIGIAESLNLGNIDRPFQKPTEEDMNRKFLALMIGIVHQPITSQTNSECDQLAARCDFFFQSLRQYQKDIRRPDIKNFPVNVRFDFCGQPERARKSFKRKAMNFVDEFNLSEVPGYFVFITKILVPIVTMPDDTQTAKSREKQLKIFLKMYMIAAGPGMKGENVQYKNMVDCFLEPLMLIDDPAEQADVSIELIKIIRDKIADSKIQIEI